MEKMQNLSADTPKEVQAKNEESTMNDIGALVNRFLAWPLPLSVQCDPCACTPAREGDEIRKHRSGTTLLTADEARQMIEYLLAPPVAQEAKPEQLDAVGRMFMEAAIKSGNEGAVRLAAQLAGIAPCPKCDYIKLHCRCPAPRAPEGYREGMLRAAEIADDLWQSNGAEICEAIRAAAESEGKS